MKKNLNDVISGMDDIFSSAKQGNYEEALNKTKIIAGKAAKKSAERLEISKKKIELLDSKTKLAKAYEAFGRLQYSALEGENVPQEKIDSAVAEIQLHKTRADILDDEIERMKAIFTEGIAKAERDLKKCRENAHEVESVDTFETENGGEDQ